MGMARNISLAGRGSDFEKSIGKGLKAYAAAGVAQMDFMPVPTAPAGVRSKSGAQLRVLKGKAPFDVYGFTLDGDAHFVGCELKDSKREARLPLVGMGKKGNGVQFHQMSALASVAKNRGIARLVWCNGGEVGVLDNTGILQVWEIFLDADASTQSGRTPARGSKSIAWERFTPTKIKVFHGEPIEDWLGL